MKTKHTYFTGKYKYVIIFYAVTFLLSELIRATDKTNSIVYEPAHLLFGDFKYLDFYLAYGVPVIYCLMFVIITTVEVIRYLIFDPKEKKYGYSFIVAYLISIIITAILCSGFFPDFMLSLNDKYVTAESNNFTFEREYNRGGRKSFGYYEYTALVYDNMGENTGTTSQLVDYFNSQYTGNSLHLKLSPYLYNQAKELKSYNPLSLKASTNAEDSSDIKWVPAEEYMLVQFHYLPNSQYLVSYTVSLSKN